MTDVPHIVLHNGVAIPQLGFGVFKIAPAATAGVVAEALRVGYRHIDTAEMYANEAGVGEAIARSGLPPDAVFVTSKINNVHIGYDAALRAFEATLQAIGRDVIDLMLIHWPLAMVRDYLDTWRALEAVYRDGRARAIGVSNFQIAHLERLMAESDVLPAVNQVELHPYLSQEPLRAFHEAHGIVTEAWSPLARGAVLDDPAVVAIATSHHRAPAQVVLRWHIQLGNVVFPKSATPARIAENFAIFDFSLSEEEMAILGGLNSDHRFGPDPDLFDLH
jgi:2,5-diketo-D-gluconate reductase A